MRQQDRDYQPALNQMSYRFSYGTAGTPTVQTTTTAPTPTETFIVDLEAAEQRAAAADQHYWDEVEEP